MAKAEKSENLRLEVVTVTPGRKGLGEQQSCMNADDCGYDLVHQ